MTDYPALADALIYLSCQGYRPGPALWGLAVKTYGFFLMSLQRLIRDVYQGDMGEGFIDATADLIASQLRRAWNEGMRANDLDPAGDMLPEWEAELQDAIADQFPFVDTLYSDIIDAREAEAGTAALLSRAELWANQYNSVVNQSKITTARKGAKLVWVYGDTEHCDTCLRLNGIVAFASEWAELGVRPQSPPNGLLVCGGWKCQCRLDQTTARRSPNAAVRITAIVGV